MYGPEHSPGFYDGDAAGSTREWHLKNPPRQCRRGEIGGPVTPALADFVVEDDRGGARAVTAQAGVPTPTLTAPAPGETNTTQGPSNESTPNATPQNETSA